MGYRDYYKGPLRDYHRDPFPHTLLRTRKFFRTSMRTYCMAFGTCWVQLVPSWPPAKDAAEFSELLQGLCRQNSGVARVLSDEEAWNPEAAVIRVAPF